jgi:midasin
MTYLDGLSSLPQFTAYSRHALEALKSDALEKLQALVPLVEPLGSFVPAHDPSTSLQLGSFAIPKGTRTPSHWSFNFTAPTTLTNAMRVIRACQVSKPILLEGSPGVGKTSLVTALSNISGHQLCRINLSDQTDLIDLFGSDLPVEGGGLGEFAWRDAEFLKALQEGHWVLLDEMNLAPQAVLEGLNAILDHRGTVYIPELNRSFSCHPSFRIFAAQNPLSQGGGRKGLPKSFVNRFSKVYIEELIPSDLYTICQHAFPAIEESTLRAMISFNLQLNEQINVRHAFAHEGSPWEFNLRDITRWSALLSRSGIFQQPQEYLRSIYLHRFRSQYDRRSASSIFNQAFSTTCNKLEDAPSWTLSATHIQFGHFTISRKNMSALSRPRRILKSQLSTLESLGDCVAQSWLAIVIGQKNCGKTDVVRALAHFTGNQLQEISMNSTTDTMDILGSFEQVDNRRRLLALIDDLILHLELDLRSITGSKKFSELWSRSYTLRHLCEAFPGPKFGTLLEATISLITSIIDAGSEFEEQYRAVQDAIHTLHASHGTSQFEWVDGPLIKAMKSGHWLLMDGANLCSPSVLDRLNSLCESEGFVILSERGFVDGQVQLIKPHPSFRLFMSVDPHYGELSRAMRNRGVEIAILTTPMSDDYSILLDYYRLPLSSKDLVDPIVQGATFDAARRGLLQVGFSDLNISSTGRSLDQDSALSSLVDQVPALLISSAEKDEHPWIFFLCRSLTPAYMQYLTRYLASCDSTGTISPSLYKFLSNFPNSDMRTAHEEFQQSYALHRKVSGAYLLTQVGEYRPNICTF